MIQTDRELQSPRKQIYQPAVLCDSRCLPQVHPRLSYTVQQNYIEKMQEIRATFVNSPYIVTNGGPCGIQCIGVPLGTNGTCCNNRHAVWKIVFCNLHILDVRDINIACE